MVQIQEEHLVITIEHPCPADFLEDLKKAIIDSIQNQQPEMSPELAQPMNATLLELLRGLL